MAEFKYEIIQYIACLSEGKNGWNKELNYVSWAGKEPKYDIRPWSSDHTKMGRGITLLKEELNQLKSVLEKLD